MATKDKDAPQYVAQPLLAAVEAPVIEETPRISFRDPWAALLLIANIGALAYCAIKFGKQGFEMSGDIDVTSSLFTTAISVSVIGLVLSGLYVSVLMRKAGEMITFSFYVKIALWTMLVVAAFAFGQISTALFFLFFLAITVCYWRMVQNRM